MKLDLSAAPQILRGQLRGEPIAGASLSTEATVVGSPRADGRRQKNGKHERLGLLPAASFEVACRRAVATQNVAVKRSTPARAGAVRGSTGAGQEPPPSCLR